MRTQPESGSGVSGEGSAVTAGTTADDSPLLVVLDYRENPSRLPERTRKHWPHVEVRRLAVGDVQIGRVLIERKEAHDFLQSLRSGRLFGQAYKLKGVASPPLLILEGDPYPLVAPQDQPSLRGAVLSMLTGVRHSRPQDT